MQDDSLMPFGVHKEKSLEDVPATYLLWLLGAGKCSGELKEYIEDNKAVLEKEIKEKPYVKFR